jgi:hypothetical protein
VLEHLEQISDAGESGPPTCPDCNLPMPSMQYMKTGPYLARCGNCMGVFVTARQLRPLAEFAPGARRSLWEWLRDKILPDGGDGGSAADAGEQG